MKISLGNLKDKGEDLATFLEPRVGAKPALSGDSIEIEDGSVREGVKPRHVKTYIKRFMYMNGVRKNYRVFVAGKELTIQEIELGKEEEKEKAKPEVEEAPSVAEKAEPAKEEPSVEEAEAGEPEAPAEPSEPPKPEKAKKSAVRKPRTRKKTEAEG